MTADAEDERGRGCQGSDPRAGAIPRQEGAGTNAIKTFWGRRDYRQNDTEHKGILPTSVKHDTRHK